MNDTIKVKEEEMVDKEEPEDLSSRTRDVSVQTEGLLDTVIEGFSQEQVKIVLDLLTKLTQMNKGQETDRQHRGSNGTHTLEPSVIPRSRCGWISLEPSPLPASPLPKQTRVSPSPPPCCPGSQPPAVHHTLPAPPPLVRAGAQEGRGLSSLHIHKGRKEEMARRFPNITPCEPMSCGETSAERIERLNIGEMESLDGRERLYTSGNERLYTPGNDRLNTAGSERLYTAGNDYIDLETLYRPGSERLNRVESERMYSAGKERLYSGRNQRSSVGGRDTLYDTSRERLCNNAGENMYSDDIESEYKSERNKHYNSIRNINYNEDIKRQYNGDIEKQYIGDIERQYKSFRARKLTENGDRHKYGLSQIGNMPDLTISHIKYEAEPFCHKEEMRSPSSQSETDSEGKKAPRLCRDQRVALGMDIPISVHEIIRTPMEEFNDLLSRHQLSEEQINLCRDIRRRGKNKIAAQNCRKRKLSQITCLEMELTEARVRKEVLVRERVELLRKRREWQEKLERLEKGVLGGLGTQQGSKLELGPGNQVLVETVT